MLLIVLMVVTMSTLAATFAVHDTMYELKGTRGVQQSMAARYIAEAGGTSAPSVVARYGADAFRAMLVANAPNQLGPTSADEDEDTGRFPHERYNIPPPTTPAFWAATHEDVSNVAFPALGSDVAVLVDDPHSPHEPRYEVIYETHCQGDMLHVTVSTYGRQSMDPDLERNDPSNAEDYRDEYHDTVSLSRAYYTANMVNGCGNGTR